MLDNSTPSPADGLTGFRPLTLSEFARLKEADEIATAHLHWKQADHLKAKRRARWPIPCTDEDGTDCYLVPLNDRHEAFALVEAKDFWKVYDSGIRGMWSINNLPNGFSLAQVNVPSRDEQGTKYGTINLARLILGPALHRIEHRNGNGLDLRRKNLAPSAPPSRRKRPATMPPEVARMTARVRDRMAAEVRLSVVAHG
ncbi:hypothetical protein [Rhodovulum adriaticum]|uniref:HNH endonuclease n=1 Tax=Rhodovulum adriaticum TaxID=35804 RepID=A0A4R2NIQ5_RHOAD|nr:hypothetical protein [Rhodovulum adriaticum]MBK1635850.1 hypothetical protein [Rhodovulum adriaticum]TCP20984.1 hypothetical protein EV656_1141 [Rhodovulum adriaticum]